ncbi:MAG: serine/threonine-protein kinase [Terriglobales bacterium]
MALILGTKLGPYEIQSSLGAGGMGEVYRATDTKLGRDIALKVLPAEMAGDPERLGRFRREAKALAQLDHPNIVIIHSVEECDGVHFLTMQLVEGQPLDRLICAGGLPLEQIVEIARALGDALAAAHEKGIVHRDLKPANVMVSKRQPRTIVGASRRNGAGCQKQRRKVWHRKRCRKTKQLLRALCLVHKGGNDSQLAKSKHSFGKIGKGTS